MPGFYVEDWMLGEGLGLKGCELLVFVYAYSFFRDGKEMFAAEERIGDLICYSRKQVGVALSRLCEKGLLIRSEKKHRRQQTYAYSVCEEKVRTFVTSGCEESSQQDEKKLPTGMGRNVTSPCNETSHNETSYIKTYDNSDNIDKSDRVKKEKSYGIRNQRCGILTVGHSEDFAEPDRL